MRTKAAPVASMSDINVACVPFDFMKTKAAPVASMSDINVACVRVAISVIACYCMLVCAVFAFFGSKRVWLEPTERAVAAAAAVALSTSLVLRTTSSLSCYFCSPVPRTRFAGAHKASGRTTGVAWLSHVTNLIAAVTSWLFFFFDVPILWDPVTLCHVHPIRWCE